MAKCLKCGKEAAEYDFRAIEILTLHIRDLNGERRVQALGEQVEMPVCRTCAKARLDRLRNPGPRLRRSCLPFGLILVLGIVLAVVFWRGEGALRLLGLAAAACGVVGLASTIRTAQSQRVQYGSMPEEEALRKAAWQAAVDASPKKAGENDVTYLPVDDESRACQAGELLERYELLPKIAVQAYQRLHPEEEPQ